MIHPYPARLIYSNHHWLIEQGDEKTGIGERFKTILKICCVPALALELFIIFLETLQIISELVVIFLEALKITT
jgi:hypothetical protein